ncbi:MAG TPA: 5'-nucleotidase C-terminal domain-containing protein [Thermoanaerobaculia bacterium]
MGFLLAATTVTLLHFSDYHSHALPFYTDQGERGGIARAIGYLEQQKRGGALVFSGGDMINKGAPAWSDHYQCAEWPWFNGIVSAMAFGNHEPDYGREAFERCRKKLRYPILSANTPGFKPYVVLKTKGVRIGVFALAGDDFEKLNVGRALARPGRDEARPAFGDPVAAARSVVATLRDKERVDAVVLIGHQSTEEDYELARAVPGIDLIFGSHSHLERALTQIPGTKTAFVSPGQYLTNISRVELTIDEKRVQHVRGGLIPVEDSMPVNAEIEKRVARMQIDLERAHPDLFEPIGKLETPMSTETVAQRALLAMRDAAKADVAVSTKSSFRGALPAGPLTLESLRAALPYDNELVVCTMSEGQLRGILDDAYVTPFEPKAQYRVATTDYLAFVAYKLSSCERTGMRVREELRKRL